MTFSNEWHKPDSAFGNRILTNPQQPATTAAERRSHDRILTHFHATAFCHDRYQSVVVRNISPGGLMMSNAFGLAVGDNVVISTLTGHPYTGRVAWSVAPFTGLAFTSPISLDDPLFKHRLPTQDVSTD